ncbi:hypothetical protein CR513_31893, partial [Mucuna pruriens]
MAIVIENSAKIQRRKIEEIAAKHNKRLWRRAESFQCKKPFQFPQNSKVSNKVAKAKVSRYRLYSQLLIPTSPWVDISMDLLLGLPKSKRDRDSIFMVVDRFFKMTHFIPCHKLDDACHVANLFFKEVVRLHGLLETMVLDSDSKFLNYFWETLWKFAYNRVVNTTASHSRFELVMTFLRPNLSRNYIIRHMRIWRGRVCNNRSINKGKKGMVFKEGDLVLIV